MNEKIDDIDLILIELIDEPEVLMKPCEFNLNLRFVIFTLCSEIKELKQQVESLSDEYYGYDE